MVLLRAKKRKQRLVISKLQTITIEKKDVKELKQEGTTKKKASSSADHPLNEVSNLLYQSIDQRHDPPSTTNVGQGNNIYTVPNITSSHTNEVDSVNQPYEVSNLLYQSMDQHCDPPSAANVLQESNIYTVPNTASSHTSKVDSANQPLYEVSNLLYQSMDQHCDHPITANLPQGNDFYVVPDITSSHTIEADNGNYETVYSEPLQPSLFTDAVETPSDCEYVQPCDPNY